MNRENSATFTAVGDILLHGRVYGGTNKKNNFQFEEQLNGVKALLGKTDITMANLETPIAGTEFGLSSFPKFNGPKEIAKVLKNMGVDIVTLANNHVLDQGEEGLLKTIENLDEVGLVYDGAYKNLKDNETLRIFNVNGLKVCFISYTSGTNGIRLPEGKEYLVNTFIHASLLRLTRMLRKIKREGIADAIIVNLHFGEEYHLHPTYKQREQVRSIADAGANVIIGHHPHVLQPPEWIETSLGTKTFVAYSMGNFFSGQDGLYRQVGATLSLKLNKPNLNYRNVIVEDPEYNLTFVNQEKRLRYDIYTFKDWMRNNRYIETLEGKFPSEEVYENVRNRMRANITDLRIQ